MRGYKFEFYADRHIALLDIALILRELTVTDFVRMDNATIGHIGYGNIERRNILQSAVDALALNGEYLAGKQSNLCRRRDTPLSTSHRITPCTVDVRHILLLAV